MDKMIFAGLAKGRWWVLLAMTTAAICLGSAARADVVNDRFGGTKSTSVVAHPDLVEAWRTTGSLRTNYYYGEDLWRKSGPGTLVSTNVASELSRLLLDPNTYINSDSSKPKTDAAWPIMMVKFVQGTNAVDVFFSFNDNSIGVKVGEDRFKLPTVINSDVDAIRPQLVTIAKKIFPKDPVIGSLPEKP